MKTIRIFAILLIAAFSTINAQSDFRPGKVWKASGDTLYGSIDYRGDMSLAQECRFKSRESKQVQTLSPLKIKGYRFEDDRLFIAEELDDKWVFLECLINGAMEVYYYRDETKTNQYYFRKAGDTLVHLSFIEEIRYFKTNKINDDPEENADYLFRSKKHIGLLKYHLQDAPEL